MRLTKPEVAFSQSVKIRQVLLFQESNNLRHLKFIKKKINFCIGGKSLYCTMMPVSNVKARF